MASFKVTGGNKLAGAIIPQGAKNEAMQVICAALLTDEPVTITNLPDILDINNLIDLLKGMGVVVDRKSKSEVTLHATINAESILAPRTSYLAPRTPYLAPKDAQLLSPLDKLPCCRRSREG